MELSDEQLEKITDYASCFLRIDDISLLLGLDSEQFRKETLKKGTKAHIAYELGKLTTRLELHRSITKMAKLGSPQAQKDIFGLIDYQNKNERKIS